MNRRDTKRTGNALRILIAALFLAAGSLLPSAQTARAETKARILVMPFTIHAADDLAYLKRGITDMLTSRLEQGNQVVVVTPDSQKDADLRALKKSADYVVTGSVTILGDSVSTDAQVARGTAMDEPVLSFGRTGAKQADVIAHIHALAATINARLIDRDEAAAGAPKTALVPVPVPLPAGGPDTAPAITAAPAPAITKEPTTPPPPQDAMALTPVRIPGIGEFKAQLNGLAAGDVDGDGIAEIVTITINAVFVHRFHQGRWIKLTEYAGSGDFVGVDAADVNGNGRQEIFITRFRQAENSVRSFVLEWDGKRLSRIVGQMPWYFRTVDLFRRGRVLVGQRQGQGNPFATGIYEIQWTGDGYGPGKRLALPPNLHVFGFAQGAVRSPERPEVVTYGTGGYVQLLGPTGKEAWATTERYGGGANFLVFNDEEQWDAQNYLYLPPRILLHDTDGDGVQEMLVVNNQLSIAATRALDRHRFYAKGRLESLQWHGEGIRPTRRTLDMARFIADTALVDVDGDGHPELVAAVVKKARGITAKGSGYLTHFDFDLGKR